MHPIKTFMLLTSTILVNVQAMRIDVRLVMNKENPGLRAADKLMTTTTQHSHLLSTPHEEDLTLAEEAMQAALNSTLELVELLKKGPKYSDDWVCNCLSHSSLKRAIQCAE